jgi:chromosome segregation ATPase
MIKKSLLVGAGVLLLAGIFVGRDAVSYVTTSVGQVHQSFKDTVPVDFEIARVRQMIKDLEPEVRENMHRIAREEVEIAKLERDLDRNRDELATSQNQILRLKDDLSTGNSHFVYVGRTYSADRVRSDLANRFEHFKTVKSTVDQMTKILEARQNCLNAAREKLDGMLAAKRQLEVEVENLQARSKMVEVAQTTSEFNFDDSQLARTRELIDDISARLEVNEKLLNSTVQLQGQIPLEGSPTDAENIVDTITQYFEERPEMESFVSSSTE